MNYKELSEYYNFSEDALRLLYTVYKKDLVSVLNSLKEPSSRFYVRTNTLKITSHDLITKLKRKNLTFFVDPYFYDAIYTDVYVSEDLPLYEKKIIVDKQTAESILLGSDLFAPGVLRIDKIRVNDNVTILDQTGDAIGSGIAKMSSKDILIKRNGLAVKILYKKYNIPSINQLDEYFEGLLYPQNYPSIIAAHVLSPKVTDIVVDVCAGIGGKTTGIAQLMKNKGQIFAIERSSRRINRLIENLNRLGIKNVKPIKMDVLLFSKKIKKPFADRVLVDPPCSGLGLRPKIFEKRKLEEIFALVNYQKKILKAAYNLLKPGGILVYSTCTLTIEENEEITYFLANELGMVSNPPSLPKSFLQKYFPKSYNVFRFHPHMHNSIGFFITRYLKP